METWEFFRSVSLSSFAFLAFVPLYSHFATRTDALRCQNRGRIVAHLRAHGPLRLAVLSREVGLDIGTVREHVRVLRLHSHVRVVREGAFAVVALPGQDPARVIVTAAQRAEDAVLRVVIDHHGEIRRAELDRFLPALSVRNRNRAVDALARRGALRRDLDRGIETVRLRAVPPPVLRDGLPR